MTAPAPDSRLCWSCQRETPVSSSIICTRCEMALAGTRVRCPCGEPLGELDTGGECDRCAEREGT